MTGRQPIPAYVVIAGVAVVVFTVAFYVAVCAGWIPR